jgi:hypothetical protein
MYAALFKKQTNKQTNPNRLASLYHFPMPKKKAEELRAFP